MQDEFIKLDIEKKKILFICGSLNQTMMMHSIAAHLSQHNCFFSPYYADGYVDTLAVKGYLDWSILGHIRREEATNYLLSHGLKIDYKGQQHSYDLVVTCSDLIVPKNIRKTKIVLVQEGMTDPKNILYYMVKWFNLPRYLASTSTNGMSDAYDYFCVASDGYRDFFTDNGLNPDKIIVTGIPNFDNCVTYYNNDFPYKNFVLAATSDARETFKYENRKKFIYNTLDIAAGREVVFKLHPNENVARAVREINEYAPQALVFDKGNVHQMIANSDVLVTKFSTCVYTGLALGKEVYSDFDIEELRRLTPLQNGGTSGRNIAEVCEKILAESLIPANVYKGRFSKKIQPVRIKIKNLKYRKTKKAS